MPEREFSMVPVGVEYVCDNCQVGTMEPHGKVSYLTDPIQFPHKCASCGHVRAFAERYPNVRWRRAEAQL